jgi:hypothetical protein
MRKLKLELQQRPLQSGLSAVPSFADSKGETQKIALPMDAGKAFGVIGNAGAVTWSTSST